MAWVSGTSTGSGGNVTLTIAGGYANVTRSGNTVTGNLGLRFTFSGSWSSNSVVGVYGGTKYFAQNRTGGSGSHASSGDTIYCKANQGNGYNTTETYPWSFSATVSGSGSGNITITMSAGWTDWAGSAPYSYSFSVPYPALPSRTVTYYPDGGTYNGSTATQTYTGSEGSSFGVGFPTPPIGNNFASYHSNIGLSGISSSDSVFESGLGGISVYNNLGNGTVTLTRTQDNNVPSKSYGGGSVGYKVVISKSSGSAYPGCGGFYLATGSSANHVYRCFIWAKIPTTHYISDYRNSIGDGGYSVWLTDQRGTGDWYKYMYEVHAGSSGSFSTFGHVALSAYNGDNTSAVSWEVCATQITDITSNLTCPYANGYIECYYSPVIYTIQYNSNGGSSTPASQTKTYDMALTLQGAISRNNSTGSGYTTSFSGNGGTYSGSSITATDTYSYSFAGWKSSASGTTYGASASFSENNAATMTAQWNSSTSRGSITLPAASTVSRQYYTFGGWNTNSAGTGTNYNAGASYTPSSSSTLYAKWTVNAPSSASVTASYISRTKIDVEVSAEGAEITNYTVYYRVNGSGTSYSSLSLGAGTTGTITGLQPNTTYQIYVKATNATGNVDSSTITAKTIPNIPTVSAPTVTTPHPFTPTLQIPASGDTNALITNYTLYWCANPNVNTYDMPLKVTSDGALWARIFYQQSNEGTTYFSTLEECRNTQTANKYSRMYLLEDNTYKINGKFEFMLCYPNNDSTHYNRWKQTNAPQNEYVARVSTGSQVTGYEAVHIDWTSNYWGGLERSAEDPATLDSCWLDGSVGHGNWYYSLGTTTLYKHGMPATADLIENTWSCVELWVRVGTVTASSQSFGSSSSGQAVNLSEETEYLFWGQATNIGGTTSGPGLIYTTPADQAKIYRKNNGTWERGKAYYKINGEWVKAKKIYIKVNGEWKINSNGGS